MTQSPEKITNVPQKDKAEQSPELNKENVRALFPPKNEAQAQQIAKLGEKVLPDDYDQLPEIQDIQKDLDSLKNELTQGA